MSAVAVAHASASPTVLLAEDLDLDLDLLQDVEGGTVAVSSSYSPALPRLVLRSRWSSTEDAGDEEDSLEGMSGGQPG